MKQSSYPENTTGVTHWNGREGRPIKTAGYLVLVCTSGMASFSADMQRLPFRHGDMLVVSQDIFLLVNSASKDFMAAYISLADNMLELAYSRLTDMSLWTYLHCCPLLKLTGEQQRLVTEWIEQQQWIFDNMAEEAALQMVSANVFNLFMAVDYKLNESGVKDVKAYTTGTRAILNRFWTILFKHFPAQRSVKFYADALNITPEYFYKVCHHVYGMSPKALIDQQLIAEIKTYLSDTDMTVKEIADRMCFEDDSYMCRFFRRATGQSPLQWRNITSVKKAMRMS